MDRLVNKKIPSPLSPDSHWLFLSLGEQFHIAENHAIYLQVGKRAGGGLNAPRRVSQLAESAFSLLACLQRVREYDIFCLYAEI